MTSHDVPREPQPRLGERASKSGDAWYTKLAERGLERMTTGLRDISPKKAVGHRMNTYPYGDGRW